MTVADLKRGVLAAVATISLASGASAQSPSCTPDGKNKPALEALKAKHWVLPDDASRNRFALALTECLGDPDPVLRDEIATEALQHYLRDRLLSDATMLKLADILQAQLAEDDPDGLRRPFAALNLAEVARADRIKLFLSADKRDAIMQAAIHYMTGIDDYRGFDHKVGYRHAVAHASDLMLQLALNPALDKQDLIAIRSAIATQIAPKGQFYITSESERLARAILYMAQRNLFTEAEWAAWLGEIAGPGELGTWDNWFKSPEALARRHNLMALLTAIYVNVDLSANAAFAPLLPGTSAALKAMP